MSILIEKLCRKYNAFPILIALGGCHGDNEIVLEIGKNMQIQSLIMERPGTLKEVVACISQSDLYVGSSLHGLITAFSFNKRSVIIADEAKVGFKKFSGFLKHFNKLNLLCSDWENSAIVIEKALNHAKPIYLTSRISQVLNNHWMSIKETLFNTDFRKADRL